MASKITKALNKAGINAEHLAVDLMKSVANTKNMALTRQLAIGDDVYTFKVTGHTASSLFLYGSEDDGATWHFIDSWSDH
jgi:hypothetical protein